MKQIGDLGREEALRNTQSPLHSGDDAPQTFGPTVY
jgi:hypothetical protein